MVNNVDRVDPRELQSLQLYLNDYRQQAEIFTQQLALLEEGRMEALAAIEALEGAAAAPDSIVLLHIGTGVSEGPYHGNGSISKEGCRDP